MPEHSSFPSNSYEAIAMLYVKNQDISAKTPEELYRFFMETQNRIYKYAKENKYEDWMRLR